MRGGKVDRYLFKRQICVESTMEPDSSDSHVKKSSDGVEIVFNVQLNEINTWILFRSRLKGVTTLGTVPRLKCLAMKQKCVLAFAKTVY